MSDNNNFVPHPSNHYDGLDSDDDDDAISIDSTSSNDRIAGNNRLRPMVLSWNNRPGIQINGDVEQPSFIFLLPSIERARTAIAGFFDRLSIAVQRQLKQVNEAHVVIVFESDNVMSELGLTSKDDILNLSPREICINVVALKVCTSKQTGPNSVLSTFGGRNSNVSSVTWDSGPVLHRVGLTLVKYNSGGIGGTQFQTPPMSDIHTNGNDLVSMGSSGLVPRIRAVRHMLDHQGAAGHQGIILVYDALNGDGTSLISIQLNQQEGFDFFPADPSNNGYNFRTSFTLQQVHDSMPGGLPLGVGENIFYCVKVLMLGQRVEDLAVVGDADARIAAINNRMQEVVQANAPDGSKYGKDCIVYERGRGDIAKFTSMNLAKGKNGKYCPDYDQFGVGQNAKIGTAAVDYKLKNIRAAMNEQRQQRVQVIGLQSKKFPTRYLRLCREGEFNNSSAPNPWDDDN